MDTIHDTPGADDYPQRRLTTAELQQRQRAAIAQDKAREAEETAPGWTPPLVSYPFGVRGMPHSKRGDRWGELHCVFCGCWWPPVAVLEQYRLCLHCAQFDGRTRSLAQERVRENVAIGFSSATKFTPYNWQLATVADNRGRSCANCGLLGGQTGNPSSTLGVEHWCIACIIERERPHAPHSTLASAPQADDFEAADCLPCGGLCVLMPVLRSALDRWQKTQAGRQPKRSDLLRFVPWEKSRYYELLKAHGIAKATWPPKPV